MVFYGISFILVMAGAWKAGLGPLFLPPAALFALHLSRQAAGLDVADPKGALRLFKSNTVAGLILVAALALGLWKPGGMF